MMNRTLLAAAISLTCVGAFAQTTTATTVQRDVAQQARIESGLTDGSLSTKEAGKLEKEEGRVDRMQSQALKDGKLSASERTKLNAAQNKVSRDIAAERHDAVTGNPNSTSSKRMQADVARNLNQEKRIEAGVESGSLTRHEVSKLERGQAHVDAKEARAARDGHVGKSEQTGVQRAENNQSKRIRRERHDAQTRG
jgi:hypothetical protein